MESLFLNLTILFYLLVVAVEDTFKTQNIHIKDLRNTTQRLAVKDILPLLLFPFFIVLLLLRFGIHNLLTLYIFSIFSFTILCHAVWVSRKLDKKKKTVIFIIAIGCITFRIYTPAILIHDIFVILLISWLGPLLTSFHFFTKKIFSVLSFLWFSYDIWYVWLSPSYQQVSAASKSVGFPLSLIAGHASIGVADLLWASLLLAIVHKQQYKWVVLCVLFLSNLLLDFYAQLSRSFTVFPLLMLWVPLGIFILFLDHVTLKNNLDIRGRKN